LAYYIKNNEPAAPSPQLSCESPLWVRNPRFSLD
jgi:hypothetical protein